MMFTGTFTALITPFHDDVERSVDFDALTNVMEWQLEKGINGFVVCGTTGEAATMTPAERAAVIKHVVDVTNKRVPVIAGTGTNNTTQTVAATKEAKELGVDAALVVNPYYNKPTQEGLYQHYKAAAEQGGLPVILYNIPGRSAVSLSIDTFKRLAALPEVIAVKESTGSAENLMQLVESVNIDILSGEDTMVYLMMSVGGKGVISASANVIPEKMLAITNSFLKGDRSSSLAAQVSSLAIIRAMFAEANPGPAKAALKEMGIIPSDTLRLPLVTVTEETRALLKRVLSLS
jgi:4-hydroxy-tetrahydrodipicolinate synthase